MNSKQLIEIFETLKISNSRLYKQSVLEKYWYDDKFKQFIKYVYDPKFLIGVKKKIPINVIKHETKELFDCFDEFLNIIETKAHSSKTWLPFFNSLNYESQLCFNMLIKKSMECGVDISTLNKIEPSFIFQMPCMLANTYNEKTSKYIKFPAIVQLKADGARANIIVKAGSVRVLTRTGEQLDDMIGDYFKEYLPRKDIIKYDVVYDGELVYKNLERKTSNGLINKCIQGTIQEHELEGLEFHVWDTIGIDSFYNKKSGIRDYETTTIILQNTFANNPRIKPIESKVVNNINEALDIYNSYIKQGYEGAMLKNINFAWEDKRSNNILKIKEFQSMELIAKEFIEGEGKYKGMLGSIRGISPDGKIEVYVGTGFDDDMRKEFWKNRRELANSIMEVGYNKIIDSKTDKKKSLFLPVFLRFRYDIKI